MKKQFQQLAITSLVLSMAKETGRRLRINEFRIKALNLARENLRSLDSQKPGFCSKTGRVFRPVCSRSSLSQLNFMGSWKTSVDSEISLIDLLGVECRKYGERESKNKPTSWAHKDCPDDYASSSYQLDASHRWFTTICNSSFMEYDATFLRSSIHA
jgi:hypothetical protein